MNGHEHNIPVLVHQLHYLMHPAFVIPHPDKTAEHPDTVIDVHHIVTYVECSQVVKCQMFALLHCPSDTHPVETVENLMV